MNATELLQDNDLILLDSFSAEQCPENSEIKIKLPQAVPEIAELSIPTVADPKPELPPEEFFSALEAARMGGPNHSWDMRPHVLDKASGTCS